MTLGVWWRSVVNGWRMQRAVATSLGSLRSVSVAHWLPVHRMSKDELDASVVNFSWLARISGMPLEDIAASVRAVREAHAYAHRGQHGSHS